MLGLLFKDNVILGKLRFFGYIGVFAICGFLYWALVINDWCNMFYFGSMFSLNDELVPEEVDEEFETAETTADADGTE